jgi:threonine dehydratase
MQADTIIKRILSAPVYDVAIDSPVDSMPLLSKRLGCDVRVKREDLQPVFSFKLRGAYTKMSRLPAGRKRHGVVAASAGNHAQGVALAASRLQMGATIFMPVTTPDIKVQAVRRLGGRYVRVVLQGDRFDDACNSAVDMAEREGLAFIHPYDDADIIAGQGTIGMEIVQHLGRGLDAVFIPVGGGGLIAGVATYIKYVHPEIRVIGVEADDSACLQAALKAGRRIKLPQTGIFADGVSVAQVGKLPFALCRKYVDDVVTVTTDEICAAIKTLFDDTRSISEPAGALALAGLVKYGQCQRVKGKSVLAIVSGANMNFDRLRFVSERYAVGEGSEVLLGVTIPERPGSLLELCACTRGYDITELNHRYTSVLSTHVFLGIRLKRGKQDRDELLGRLRRQGYAIEDMSGNTLAKLHVCHMIGGRRTDASEEIYRFELPERPGILVEFLARMRKRWNLSLFQYRQHGGCYANVLVGLQCIQADAAASQRELEAFVAELGYPCVRESDNPVYRMFLGD